MAVYTAKVRLKVQANGATIVREGNGTGEGRGEFPGEVHDTALKAALATFGGVWAGARTARAARERKPSPGSA